MFKTEQLSLFRKYLKGVSFKKIPIVISKYEIIEPKNTKNLKF